MNEAFHAVSAILLHLVSDVSIDVQREGCRGVAQVALHSFDIVSCLQCRYSVGMTSSSMSLMLTFRAASNLARSSVRSVVVLIA